MQISPAAACCGAEVTGVTLADLKDPDVRAALRAAWLKHRVIALPNFKLELDELEFVASCFGPFGADPYFENLADHPHVAEVRRNADETTPLFAGGFHSDWSFLATPPTATLLYGHVIPPIGGDTLFADQISAWQALDPVLKEELLTLEGIHSARLAYSPEGMYGERDEGRSMAIRYSEEAYATQTHAIGRRHEETGETALFVSPGYTIGIENMADEQAGPLLKRLFAHQSEEAFIYRQVWQPNMLVIWDNRSVVHAATGGYDGYDRLLHRITVAPLAA